MNHNDLILPPHSVEAEQSVIGGLLLNNNALDKIADMLNPADFYRHDHRVVYEHTRTMIEQGKPADLVTVAESLENSGELAEVGGIAYLGALVQNVPGAANIHRYASIVRDRSVLRGILGVSDSLRGDCLGHGSKDAEKIVSGAIAGLESLIDHDGGEPSNLQSVMSQVMREADRRQQAGKASGLPTGFARLDTMIGGLEPGQLVIVAARPSVGKTILGLNVATHAARTGTPSLFFSLEMTSQDIGQRVLSGQSRVSVGGMRSGTLGDHEWQRIMQAYGESEWPLFIDDRPAVTVGYIRAKARRIKRQNGLGLIVIDYLQLMRGQGDNRTQEVGSISRGLKALAKELKCPIVALCQLNRGVENRQDRRPMLSDLRDSGEIEQDADMVLMLHREEIHNDAPEWAGLAEVLVRKNRNGATGECLLAFSGEYMQFNDYTGQNPRQMLARMRAEPSRGFN